MHVVTLNIYLTINTIFIFINNKQKTQISGIFVQTIVVTAIQELTENKFSRNI